MRIVTTDVKTNIESKREILYGLSAQLSDGYWECRDFHNEFWNYLDFGIYNSRLAITVADEPVNDDVENIFTSMSDNDVMDYVGTVLKSCYEIKEDLFCMYSKSDLLSLISELKRKESDEHLSEIQKYVKCLDEEILRQESTKNTISDVSVRSYISGYIDALKAVKKDLSGKE